MADLFVKSPRLISRLTQQSLVWKIPTKEKKIFLTFDDGPIPEVTPKVLEILDNYNVKATFFCVGDNIKKNPIEFSRIIAGGHKVGNHTFNHIKGWTHSSKSYLNNIEQFEMYYQTDVFRPPYGRITPSQIRKLRNSYAIVLWTVLTYDFDAAISPEKCLQNAINNINEGSIIVFHDSIKASRNMLYALPRFIKHCKDNGYSFELLSRESIEQYRSNALINAKMNK